MNLTCIQCPLGCQIEVTMEDGKIKNISGNSCIRGKMYAEKEITAPVRIVTSTVKVIGGKRPVTSVKTRTGIPKNMIFKCMDVINNITLHSPVKMGDVVIADVLGTGVDIIATSDD
jgi:CxxC motif-containing protein